MSEGEDELPAALGRMRIVTRVAPGPAHSIPIPCRFFLEGHCANGDMCRFEHPEDDADGSDSNNNNNGYSADAYYYGGGGSDAFSNNNNNQNSPRYAHPSLALSPASSSNNNNTTTNNNNSNNPFASSGSLPTIPIPQPTNVRNISGFAPPRPEDFNAINASYNNVSSAAFGAAARNNINIINANSTSSTTNAVPSRFAPNTFVGFSVAYSSVFEASDDEDDADELLRAATTPRSSSMFTTTVGAAHSSSYAAAVTTNADVSTNNNSNNSIAIPAIWGMHPTNLASSPQHTQHSHSSSFVGSPISMLHANTTNTNGNNNNSNTGNKIAQSGSSTSLPPTANGTNANGSVVIANGNSNHAGGSMPQTSPSHTWRGTTALAVASSGVLCRFHMVGECRYGERCRYIHGKVCCECGENALHPTDEGEAMAHIAQCRLVQERKKRLERSESIDCGICYDKPVAAKRKFGLLHNCEHAFCLPCIREWRGAESAYNFGREAVRVCPICRTESFLVIPSDTYESDTGEKNILLEKYKRKLNSIPCKHFDFGRGECPFGNSCMYAHTDTDGRPIDDNEDDGCNILLGDNGIRAKTHKHTLADYLPPPR